MLCGGFSGLCSQGYALRAMFSGVLRGSLTQIISMEGRSTGLGDVRAEARAVGGPPGRRPRGWDRLALWDRVLVRRMNVAWFVVYALLAGLPQTGGHQICLQG